jgi:hypothetical protein
LGDALEFDLVFDPIAFCCLSILLHEGTKRVKLGSRDKAQGLSAVRHPATIITISRRSCASGARDSQGGSAFPRLHPSAHHLAVIMK